MSSDYKGEDEEEKKIDANSSFRARLLEWLDVYSIPELTPKRKGEMLDHLFRQIQKRRMVIPAIIFFESFKPLTNISKLQALYVSSLLSGIGIHLDEYVALYTERENIELILNRLKVSAKL